MSAEAQLAGMTYDQWLAEVAGPSGPPCRSPRSARTSGTWPRRPRMRRRTGSA